MEIGSMAALLTPRAWVYDDTSDDRAAAIRRPRPIAAMRRWLLLLVAVSALAVMLAGTLTSAEARPRGFAADGVNWAIDICFSSGGDPLIFDSGTQFTTFCVYSDGGGGWSIDEPYE